MGTPLGDVAAAVGTDLFPTGVGHQLIQEGFSGAEVPPPNIPSDIPAVIRP